MERLSKEEIMSELEQLGINSTAELKAYVEEYEKYCYLLYYSLNEKERFQPWNSFPISPQCIPK
jgi:hypothetical protein